MKWALRSAYVLLAVAVGGTLAFAIFQPVKVLPRISLAPGLALTDQDQKSLTSETLRGQIVLYNFTYTRCGEGCAAQTQVLQALQRQLVDLDTGGVPVQLVTISFDTAHDTPAVLRGFAAGVGADPGQWQFATGEAAALKRAVGGGFQVYYAPAPDGGFEFDPALVLVDGWGIIRAEYRTAAPALDRLVRDIRLVAEEAGNSDGIGRYAYEAAHLFLCYAR